jgi:hypothetical protein
MRKAVFLLVVFLAVSGPHALAFGKVKPPDLKITVSQSPDPGSGGMDVEVRVAVAAPDGIALNQYPGITLTVTPAAGLSLAQTEAFVGTKKPIEDPAQFGFKGPIDPLKLAMKVKPGEKGTRTLDGSLKFFFCVKASGYCAPGEMKLKIPVKLAG